MLGDLEGLRDWRGTDFFQKTISCPASPLTVNDFRG